MKLYDILKVRNAVVKSMYCEMEHITGSLAVSWPYKSLKRNDLLERYFLKSYDNFHSLSFLFRKTGEKKKIKEKKLILDFLSIDFKHLVPYDDEQQMVTVTKKIFCHMYVYVKGSF